LYRWFVGLSLDEPIWDPTTFTKNRDRLLESDIAGAFFDAVRGQAAEGLRVFRAGSKVTLRHNRPRQGQEDVP
jgi:transposase